MKLKLKLKNHKSFKAAQTKEFNLKSNILSIMLMNKKDFDNEINKKENFKTTELNNHLFLLSEKFFSRVDLINKIVSYFFTTTTVFGMINDFFNRTKILIKKFFNVLSYEAANSELDPNQMPVANKPLSKMIELDKVSEYKLLTDNLTAYFQDYTPYLFLCFTIIFLSCIYFFIKNKSMYKFSLIRKYTS